MTLGSVRSLHNVQTLSIAVFGPQEPTDVHQDSAAPLLSETP
jgi:hypothetical protein